MDTNHKLKPLNTDITFCEHPSGRIQCDTCARNLSRYDTTSLLFYSFFAFGKLKDEHRKCEYYISDSRHPQRTEQKEI